MTAPAGGAAAWRGLIQQTLCDVWPDMPNGLHWVEAQINAESSGDPQARSSAGAEGLMQLMPGTAREVGVLNTLDPLQSIHGGVTYLRRQYIRHDLDGAESMDRLRWAWAAYNGGFGYVRKALELAGDLGVPDRLRWVIGRNWLSHEDCRVFGRRPDWRQMWSYVDRIEAYQPQSGTP